MTIHTACTLGEHFKNGELTAQDEYIWRTKHEEPFMFGEILETGEPCEIGELPQMNSRWRVHCSSKLKLKMKTRVSEKM